MMFPVHHGEAASDSITPHYEKEDSNGKEESENSLPAFAAGCFSVLHVCDLSFHQNDLSFCDDHQR